MVLTGGVPLKPIPLPGDVPPKPSPPFFAEIALTSGVSPQNDESSVNVLMAFGVIFQRKAAKICNVCRFVGKF